ncbi:hypothetical protein BDW22DRAFT_692159 [Trametopsis cervina]|nr:hypothetical protein BDW22DRAFT_692159 [Trametopsis cervina]
MEGRHSPKLSLFLTCGIVLGKPNTNDRYQATSSKATAPVPSACRPALASTWRSEIWGKCETVIITTEFKLENFPQINRSGYHDCWSRSSLYHREAAFKRFLAILGLLLHLMYNLFLQD